MTFHTPHDIRVSAISLGLSPLSDVPINTEFMGALKAKTMLKRIGSPEDLKGTIALPSSDASSHMIGQNICVDEGWIAW